MRLHPYLLVALGGALGAVARVFVGDVVARRFGSEFPFGTLAINLTGCLVIAIAIGYLGARPGLSPGWRFFFPAGFVGAYTTFSTFAFETVRLVEGGAPIAATIYVLVSNVMGLAAVVAGSWIGRRL